MQSSYSKAEDGFTLIEISIVLVVIGLIAGVILVGQDLINAAAIQAQISQIQGYNAAVRTFEVKYNNLPGDIPNPAAGNYGFQPRGQYAGEGDGNGVLEGVYSDAAGQNNGRDQVTGENGMLWVDLSAAGLIDGNFNTATPNIYTAGTNVITTYLPRAKIGNNYVYTWSDNSKNHWSIATMTWLGSGIPATQTALRVVQAYQIDKKIDDGLPQSGQVTAQYSDWGTFGASIGYGWAGSGGVTGGPYTTATAGSSTTCFDNGNTAGAAQQYSLAQNKGNGMNCALSFEFQ
jgi:prepilin-type N-terminal cleavage/methylation domain-containing protein